MPAVDEMSYEQARDELVTVVSRLEAGDETLEGSLALWERGEALAARCQQWLDGARARLDAARAHTAPSSVAATVTEPAPSEPAQPRTTQARTAQPRTAQTPTAQPDPPARAHDGVDREDDVDRADDTEDQDA